MLKTLQLVELFLSSLMSFLECTPRFQTELTLEAKLVFGLRNSPRIPHTRQFVFLSPIFKCLVAPTVS